MDTGGDHTQSMLRATLQLPAHVVAAVTPAGGVTPSSLAAAIDACARWADARAVVAASSWPERPPGAEAVEDAIARQRAPVLVAAGNHGAVEFPAPAPGAIAVSALDDAGRRCPFSPAAVQVSARGCGEDDEAWGRSVAVMRAAATLLGA